MTSPAPRPPYVVEPGMITMRSLELVVAEHCNLSCRGCTHLAPILPNLLLDPDAARIALARLSTVARCGVLKLMGGEPLLHPRLAEVVGAVRASGIASAVHLQTNGLLIGRTPLEVLTLCDQISISTYPGIEYDEASHRRIEALRTVHRVPVVVVPMPRFQEPYSERPANTPEITRRIYQRCKVAHVWGCYTVYGVYFFKCPQGCVLERLFKPDHPDYATAGVPILASADLRRDLIDYLNSPQPLPSCARCLGTSGLWFDHQQTGRREWREAQRGTLEERHAIFGASGQDGLRRPGGARLSRRGSRESGSRGTGPGDGCGGR